MKQYTKEEIKELEAQRDKLNNIISSYYVEQDIAKFNQHISYVGKCYKLKDRDIYYKVISQYSINPYRIACIECDLRYSSLCFERIDDFPRVDVQINAFIDISDVLVSTFFDEVEEISNEEFNEKLEVKFEQFKKEMNDISAATEQYVESNKFRYIKGK